ncbi:hypothetical protein PanWU01x14_295300 [Parasponia andersonii]|uniref:Uncharacterized protein n=1 Tax=Parasponia andersonii TaxID=3476 RepID=A0A2P5AVT1_PARAD|nr:hypothetical protein PanWU01x14_295300 [Parasponia andersonii]
MRASQPTQTANSVSESVGSIGSVSAPIALTDDQIVDIVRARQQAETIATLQHQIAKQSKEQEKSQKTIATLLLQVLNEHIPNFNFQPPASSSS